MQQVEELEARIKQLEAVLDRTINLRGPQGQHMLSPQDAWDELVNKTDRTSPEEYPDHCLITFDELQDFMLRSRDEFKARIEQLEAENANLRRWKALDKPLTAAMSIAKSHLIPLHACIEQLEAALRPFADFADPRNKIPADMVLTAGSSMARKQLTMADCYAARAVLDQSSPPKAST
jgi:BMFP domain-containing protein YqiC